MGLSVEFVQPLDDDGTEYPESWCVVEPLIVFSGFARKVDAEIAMKFVLSFGNIDHSLRGDEFFRQFGFTNRSEMMAEACKRLMW